MVVMMVGVLLGLIRVAFRLAYCCWLLYRVSSGWRIGHGHDHDDGNLIENDYNPFEYLVPFLDGTPTFITVVAVLLLRQSDIGHGSAAQSSAPLQSLQPVANQN